MEKPKKVETGILPTPLQPLCNLSKRLSGAQLYIKRDDLTGFGFGGNKLRKLDYIVQAAMDEGAKVLLTYGGPQTNHGRLTAAAAAKFGMESVIMCYGQPPERATGNLLLDRMLGAEVVFMDTTKVRELPREEMAAGYYKLRDDSTQKVIDRYEAQGKKVYRVPIGGHSIEGTYGYVQAIAEIMGQMEDQQIQADYLVAGCGSGGTYAGLWLGAKVYGAPFEVVGVTVSPAEDTLKADLADHINEVSQAFGFGVTCSPEDLWVETDYYGQGYNVPDPVTREHVYMMAREEAIFLDPCYTGKIFTGFVDLIESGKIPKDKNAIFLHTGGKPGIWTEEHEDAMQSELWIDHVVKYEYEGE